MNKILLVIAREYLSRVRKKSFIVMTLLAPVLFGGFFFIIGWTATKEIDTKKVMVIDESGMFQETFIDNLESTFDYSNKPLDEAKVSVLGGEYDGLLYIPNIEVDKPDGVTFYSSSSPSITLISTLGKKLESKIENVKLERSGLNQEFIDALNADVDIHTINLSPEGGEKESSSFGSIAVGYVASFMIYIFIFVYGTQIMRGVVEEKTSRIIEVMIASVKPFQLMMGKVIGIAGVGLSQFILWIILTLSVNVFTGGLVAKRMMDTSQNQTIERTHESRGPEQIAPEEESNNFYTELVAAVESINIPLVVFSFLFYFLTGYLLYGALFAAIGSAVDSDADAQQFMLPVTLPLVASIVMLSAVLNDPNGTLAFWLSVIPFTSPVVMMMRVPFGVPIWQLALSMVLMIGGFVFTIWIASRVYRIGILMHGTKVNYKVLAKWFMMKN